MAKRGLHELEIDGGGRAFDTPDNLERLRKLFRDDRIIDGHWGPGNPGDFDHGSWHILCHLAGGTGVFRSGQDHSWVAITHDAGPDRYHATVTYREAGRVRTEPLTRDLIRDRLGPERLVGFVEGTSVGHIFARGARDARTAFNNWPRQDFDREVSDDTSDGGTVWEQWCVTRDIRPTDPICDSTLRAYMSLVSVLGGRFVAAVARGRRQHEHPRQLVGLVKGGLVDKTEALWSTSPKAIPPDAERLLLEARPADSLAAVESLAWGGAEPQYYMFKRRIDKWSPAADVAMDLQKYGGA